MKILTRSSTEISMIHEAMGNSVFLSSWSIHDTVANVSFVSRQAVSFSHNFYSSHDQARRNISKLETTSEGSILRGRASVRSCPSTFHTRVCEKPAKASHRSACPHTDLVSDACQFQLYHRHGNLLGTRIWKFISRSVLSDVGIDNSNRLWFLKSVFVRDRNDHGECMGDACASNASHEKRRISVRRTSQKLVRHSTRQTPRLVSQS